MKKLVILVIGIVAMTAAGCSNNQSSDANADAADHTQVLEQYFNAFATDVAAQMEPMKAAAAPNSPAYLYAVHQINAAIASEGANSPTTPSTATVTDGTVTMVTKGLDADTTEEQRKDATNVYSAFTYENGLISSWTTDPGGLLTPRISALTGSVTKLGITLTLKTAYVTNAGDLFITYDVQNKSKKKASVVVNGYLNPDGRQVQVSATPYQLAPIPGAFATGMAQITNGKLGGSLTIEFDYKTSARLKVA